MIKRLGLVLVTAALLSGCSAGKEHWRRVSAPTVAYLTGAQTESMLVRDVAQCACETDNYRQILTTKEQNNRFREAGLPPLVANPRSFGDCMKMRGWERVEPYFQPTVSGESLYQYQASNNQAPCALK
ncbi:MAG: hypothetical protein ACOYK8_00120 [Alphaproteobacteria bacterium]